MTKVSHEAADVAQMENPAEGFGEVIGGVDDARDVTEFNDTTVFPVLDGEVLYVDMTGSLGGDSGVDHLDG